MEDFHGEGASKVNGVQGVYSLVPRVTDGKNLLGGTDWR